MFNFLTALKITPMVFAALFPVVNPIGTALVLFGMTRGVDEQVWKSMSRKIALNAFIVLTFFFFFGGFILKLFGISIPVVQLAGGLALAFMGWNLLNEQQDSKTKADPELKSAASTIESMTFYPYTFPLTVGPGCLAVVLTFGAHFRGESALVFTLEQGAAVLGIFAICLATYFCYSNLTFITKRFSVSGAMAISKILAFFVLCLGVQIAWTGYRALNR